MMIDFLLHNEYLLLLIPILVVVVFERIASKGRGRADPGGRPIVRANTPREIVEAAAVAEQQRSGRWLGKRVAVRLTDENCRDGDVKVYADWLAEKADSRRVRVVDARKRT